MKHIRPFNDLREYTISKGLEKNFHFLGHVNDVENILIHLDLTLKLTREYNPWGRDVLESMIYGIPVISIGKYNKFIKNNFSGILLETYNAKVITNKILYLMKEKQSLLNLGTNARKIIFEKCDPKNTSIKIQKVWHGF